MMANGPLEIYAIVIGAKTYDSLFDIAVSMGLVFIPLLYVFFKGLDIYIHARASEDAIGASMKKVFFGILGLYIIGFMVFVAPTWHLDVNSIGFSPACSPGARRATFGDTGTTYDQAFGDIEYDNIRIPLGLSLALTFTSGFTAASIASLPCKTDVEAIKRTIDTTILPEALGQEVNRFDRECYAPAQAKFEQHPPNKSVYGPIMKAYGGETDLGWLGSHTLRQLYYSNQYPIAPVPGFPFVDYPYKYKDTNAKAGVQMPKWGYPDCQSWWSDPTLGLEHRLAQRVENHQVKNDHLGSHELATDISTWMAKVRKTTGIGSQVSVDDEIVHGLLYDKASNAGFGGNYQGWMQDDLSGSYLANNSQGQNGNLINFVTNVIGQAGQAKDALEGTVARSEIAQEIPILQAVLMVLVFSLGPIIFLVGMNRFSVIFTYYFILSSLIFVVFVEKLLRYIELSLHTSMGVGVYDLGNYSVMYNVFTKLYLYVPMIFLMLMSICGVMMGSGMTQAFNNPASGKGSGGGFLRGLILKAVI